MVAYPSARDTDDVLAPYSLDHLIVRNERHLRAVLTEFAGFYSGVRLHRTLRLETPLPAARPASGPIQTQPVLGGLHHTYERAA